MTLKSRDVNGLGFNICGNLRDGIFVKSLSNRGPAKESGSIHEGSIFHFEIFRKLITNI